MPRIVGLGRFVHPLVGSLSSFHKLLCAFIFRRWRKINEFYFYFDLGQSVWFD